jgi:hypothetical protein
VASKAKAEIAAEVLQELRQLRTVGVDPAKPAPHQPGCQCQRCVELLEICLGAGLWREVQ